MQDDGKLLCLKEALIKTEISTKDIMRALYDCMSNPQKILLEKENLNRAYAIVADYAKKNHWVDNAGKKHSPHLIGDDEIRGEITRILFGIPLKNLRRREERILPENPAASAAFDKPIEVEQLPTPSKVTHVTKEKPKSVSKIPPYTLMHFKHPDEKALDGFVGNEDIVNTRKLQIKGTLMRGDPPRNLLMLGPSGCGKTEFIIRIAKYAGKPLYCFHGSSLRTTEDVDKMLDVLKSGSHCFIDEVHMMTEEAIVYLFTKMDKIEEDRNKEITFSFATNLSGKLPDAFRNRCVEMRLRDYTINELMRISKQTAETNGVELADDVAMYISERCHGIARYAVNYTHDIIVENAADQRSVTLAHAKDFFMRRGIDSLGLCAEHRQYIARLAKLGQASAHSLAAALGENSVMEIERSIEPPLLKHGLLTISNRGRCLTDDGRVYARALNREE